MDGTGVPVLLPLAASPGLWWCQSHHHPARFRSRNKSSAVVVVESRLWLEKQMQDGLSLGVREGRGREDGLRAGVCQGKGYFWQR